jgi:hypothetical protein
MVSSISLSCSSVTSVTLSAGLGTFIFSWVLRTLDVEPSEPDPLKVGKGIGPRVLELMTLPPKFIAVVSTGDFGLTKAGLLDLDLLPLFDTRDLLDVIEEADDAEPLALLEDEADDADRLPDLLSAILAFFI